MSPIQARKTPDRSKGRTYPAYTTRAGMGNSNLRQTLPEQMIAWTGIRCLTLADIHRDYNSCICDWVNHDGVWEIKFPNRLCPMGHRL